MKRLFIVCLAFALLWAAPALAADIVWHSSDESVQVHSVTITDENWLFLPSGADLSSLSLTIDGEETLLNWAALSSPHAMLAQIHTGTLPNTGETLNVMVSENLRSLHLFSDDPVEHGRRWIEKDILHLHETTGSVVILNASGTADLSMRLTQLRGRGNSTWRKVDYKAPYQFKLEYAADVLKTGLASERNRTWVLLSHEKDQTFLHNEIALDLARELGLASTPDCEQIDLYYDGDYRGTYLLCEKIEVAPHSVDVLDFDKLLKPINEKYGAPDPDDLPPPTDGGLKFPEADGVNRFGLEYGYADGVYDNEMVDAGGYLLELESRGTLSDQGWFEIEKNQYISLKNPEYAGDTMLRYVSELFMEAYRTLLNYGYHPETGAPLERFVDIDSFARSHLVSELMLCEDSYGWSSTFFVLPQGQSKFYAGPVWDFDRWMDSAWPCLKENNALSRAFLRTTAFQRASKQIVQEELAPLVNNVLLGDAPGRVLQPLSVYQQQIRASWLMNYCRIFGPIHSVRGAQDILDHTQKEQEAFFRAQSAFLFEEVAAWGEDEPTHEVTLFFALPCGNPQTASLTGMENEPHGSLLLEQTLFECVQPATEEDYATWRVTFVIAAKPNCIIPDELTVYVNGEPYAVQSADGQTASLSFTYEDPTYRPAVLDGVDYGIVFDYEYYVDNYPELLDEYGDDREAVLRHFRDVGMEMGDVACEHFDPVQIFDSDSGAVEKFGADWPKYYETFLMEPGKWMSRLDNIYEPELALCP